MVNNTNLYLQCIDFCLFMSVHINVFLLRYIIDCPLCFRLLMCIDKCISVVATFQQKPTSINMHHKREAKHSVQLNHMSQIISLLIKVDAEDG